MLSCRRVEALLLTGFPALRRPQGPDPGRPRASSTEESSAGSASSKRSARLPRRGGRRRAGRRGGTAVRARAPACARRTPRRPRRGDRWRRDALGSGGCGRSRGRSRGGRLPAAAQAARTSYPVRAARPDSRTAIRVRRRVDRPIGASTIPRADSGTPHTSAWYRRSTAPGAQRVDERVVRDVGAGDDHQTAGVPVEAVHDARTRRGHRPSRPPGSRGAARARACRARARGRGGRRARPACRRRSRASSAWRTSNGTGSGPGSDGGAGSSSSSTISPSARRRLFAHGTPATRTAPSSTSACTSAPAPTGQERDRAVEPLPRERRGHARSARPVSLTRPRGCDRGSGSEERADEQQRPDRDRACRRR